MDTSLFSATFQSTLISELSRSLGDFDSHINGTLIHSDNFQALNLLQARYREQVKCIYIDPPYNTGGDGFIYKDGYQSSSWGTLIHNRLTLAKPLLNQAGVIFQSIDNNEQAKLKMISDGIFGKENFVANLIWKSKNGGGNDAKFFASDFEYIPAYCKNNLAFTLFTDKKAETTINYSLSDEFGEYTLDRLDKKALGYIKSLDFPIIAPDGTIYVVEQPNPENPSARWRWSEKLVKERYDELVFKNGYVYTKAYKKEGAKARDLLIDNRFGRTQNGKIEIKTLFNEDIFSFPKTIKLLTHLFSISSIDNDLILDYFAGSGTTAHAVINLNREDNGNRQYILVEQGEYFDTVLKPRVQKVIYSKAWKDGKPVAEDKAENLQGVPQIVKVLKLESYEDTLNNLELHRSGLFDHLPENAQQDYLLNYMLNIDSRSSLLNISHFEKPFDYGLNISTTSAGAYEWQKVDLVETFNYLIGAKVINVDDKRAEQGFVAIECRLPNQSADEKTLIFWRDCERVDYDGLQAQFDRLGINPADSEYSQVYVNGDHTLETVWDGEQSGSLKIVSIEDAFLSLMFEGDA